MGKKNKEACEKVYGKLIKEDENFYYFEGKTKLYGVTIPKNAYFKFIPPEKRTDNKGQDYENDV